MCCNYLNCPVNLQCLVKCKSLILNSFFFNLVFLFFIQKPDERPTFQDLVMVIQDLLDNMH